MQKVRSGRWKLIAVFAVLLAAGYPFKPPGLVWETLWQTTAGWIAAGFMIAAVRRMPRSARLPWWLFTAGIAMRATGVLPFAYDVLVSGHAPIPSVADAFWGAMAPCFAVGLAVLIRRRSAGGSAASIVDAAVVATGLGLLAWVLLIHPLAGNPTMTDTARAVRVAYPVADIIVLVLLARLFPAGGRRNPATWLLGVGVSAFLLNELAYVAVLSHGDMGILGHPWALATVQEIVLLGYTCFAAAASSARAHRLGTSRTGPVRGPGRRQLVVPAVAALIAPLILGAQALTGGVTEAGALAVGAGLLILLLVVRMAQLLGQVGRQSASLFDLARRDELTGLPNRRAWNESLPKALEQAELRQTTLVVAVLDLDHFKVYNDTYGHQAGDELLRNAARAWSGALRGADFLARYGGEEFVVLFSGINAVDVTLVLDRLQLATPDGQHFSAGVAAWDFNEAAEEMVRRADAALYEAKQAGRAQARIAAVATAG